MRKPICLFLLTTLLISALALGLQLRLEQRQLAAGLIRLHVVAASDDPADQRIKLRVRDAVLPVIAALTRDSADAEAAREALAEGLPAIRAAAAAELRKDPAQPAAVAVTLTEERFPRRDYATFSLPAGRYTALRVTLGAGDGHNWWCVAFPALCLPVGTEDLEQAAEAGGLTEGQVRLVTSDEPDVRLKFRLFEWLSSILD